MCEILKTKKTIWTIEKIFFSFVVVELPWLKSDFSSGFLVCIRFSDKEKVKIKDGVAYKMYFFCILKKFKFFVISQLKTHNSVKNVCLLLKIS